MSILVATLIYFLNFYFSISYLSDSSLSYYEALSDNSFYNSYSNSYSFGFRSLSMRINSFFILLSLSWTDLIDIGIIFSVKMPEFYFLLTKFIDFYKSFTFSWVFKWTFLGLFLINPLALCSNSLELLSNLL